MKKEMPPIYSSRTFSSLLIIVVTSLMGCNGTHTKSVNDKTGRIKPNMWVDKGWSNKFEGNFNLQHFQLSKDLKSDETDSIFYPIDEFQNMANMLKLDSQIKFLHVYIVAYDSLKDVKDELKCKLFLLFQPAKSRNDTSMPYYSFDSNGKFYKDTHYKRWSKFFESKKLPILALNIDSSDKVNSSHSGEISDTRRITYRRQDIDSLMLEIAYQDSSNASKVSGIRAIFASYSNTGHPYFPKHFKNRIFVMYEFTTKDSNQMDSVFYIDDRPDFPTRPNPAHPTAIDDLDSVKLHGVDNGHLCPPNCP